jgi:hypothetical protein
MGGEVDQYGCQAWAFDLATNDKLEGPKVTLDMAKKEGWFGKSGSKWQTMPELMLRYRAAAFFGRLYAPEIMMGMQTMEEVKDTITEAPDSLKDALEQMKQAETKEDFEIIKDTFTELSSNVTFLKNFQFYTSKLK